jgi:hypothetical protein
MTSVLYEKKGKIDYITLNREKRILQWGEGYEF